MSVQGVSIISLAVALLLLMGSTERGCGDAAPAPLFGLSTLLGTTAANGTSALSLLALNHLQNKIDTLTQIAELFNLAGNATTSLFLK